MDNYVPEPAQPIDPEDMKPAEQLPEEAYQDDWNGLDKILRERVRNDWDAVIAITGDEGVGKSTLINKLGKALDKRYTISEKHIMFQPKYEDMKKAMRELPKYSAVNVDEAIKVLYKLKRFDTLQILLNQLYGIARQYNLITMLAMPRYTDFNEYFRQHRIKIWIHVYKRGSAVVLMRGDNMFSSDPWFRKECEKKWVMVLKGKMLVQLSPQEVDDIMRRITPLYWGQLHFGKMRPEDEQTYIFLKAKYSSLEIGEDDEGADKWKTRTCRLTWLVIKIIGVPLDTVAEILGTQNTAVRTILEPARDYWSVKPSGIYRSMAKRGILRRERMEDVTKDA